MKCCYYNNGKRGYLTIWPRSGLVVSGRQTNEMYLARDGKELYGDAMENNVKCVLAISAVSTSLQSFS